MDLRISLSNNPIVFILVTALLSLVHLFWGGEKTFAERIRPRLRLADAGRAQALSVYYKRLTAFFLLGVAPLLFMKIVMKESHRQYGFGPGNGRFGLLYVPVVALSIVILVLSSRRSTLIRRYPEVRNAARSPSDFILSSATYALFFFGYESMYRGFLLFGLERTVGLWPAVLVSAGFSGVMHVKTPPAVIVGSLAAGFLFAHMVIIVGSIWPVFVLHTCIGIGMDALCVRTLIRKYT